MRSRRWRDCSAIFDAKELTQAHEIENASSDRIGVHHAQRVSLGLELALRVNENRDSSGVDEGEVAAVDNEVIAAVRDRVTDGRLEGRAGGNVDIATDVEQSFGHGSPFLVISERGEWPRARKAEPDQASLTQGYREPGSGAQLRDRRYTRTGIAHLPRVVNSVVICGRVGISPDLVDAEVVATVVEPVGARVRVAFMA